MSVRLIITAGPVLVDAELNDSETAQAIERVLPLEVESARWGGEVYFPVPVDMPREQDARDVLEAGDIGYWPDGKAMCIFFGPTPMSDGDEIRAASPVNIIGRVTSDLAALEDVEHGETIILDIA
jgi:hypothetical protein